MFCHDGNKRNPEFYHDIYLFSLLQDAHSGNYRGRGGNAGWRGHQGNRGHRGGHSGNAAPWRGPRHGSSKYQKLKGGTTRFRGVTAVTRPPEKVRAYKRRVCSASLFSWSFCFYIIKCKRKNKTKNIFVAVNVPVHHQYFFSCLICFMS